MKRVISIISLFTLVICLSIVPVSASTIIENGICGDNLTWTLDYKGTLIISGTGKMYDNNISWGNDPTRIRKIIIENGVTSIGISAFVDFYKMEVIELPDTLLSIEGGAFSGCVSLENIVLPNFLTSIGESAFMGCEKLWQITIPASVISIGEHAFYLCANLRQITVDKRNLYYSSDSSGVLFNKNKTTLIKYPCGGVVSNYCIPDSVKTISSCAFADSTHLKNVIISGGITLIGNQAFEGCSGLTSVEIPSSVTYIGHSTFRHCTNLTCIIIPKSITNIVFRAFDYCSNLKDIEYEGNSADWIDIDIGIDNNCLLMATINYNSPKFSTNASKNKIKKTSMYDGTDYFRYFISIDKQTLSTDYIYLGIYNSNGKMITYNKGEVNSSGVAIIDIAKVDGADYARIFAWNNYQPIAPDVIIDL